MTCNETHSQTQPGVGIAFALGNLSKHGVSGTPVQHTVRQRASDAPLRRQHNTRTKKIIVVEEDDDVFFFFFFKD